GLSSTLEGDGHVHTSIPTVDRAPVDPERDRAGRPRGICRDRCRLARTAHPAGADFGAAGADREAAAPTGSNRIPGDDRRSWDAAVTRRRASQLPSAKLGAA